MSLITLLILSLLLSNGLWVAYSFFKRKSPPELNQSQDQFYNNIIRSIDDGVIATDKRGVVVEINSVAAELTGWKHKDALGKKFTKIFKLFDPIIGELIPFKPTDVLSSGIPQIIPKDALLLSTENSSKSVAGKVTCLKNNEGQEFGTVVIFRDLTDFISQKTEITRSHQRLDSIYRAAPIGVGLLTNRVFKDVNPLFETITGYSKKEVVGQTARILYQNDEGFEQVGKDKYQQIAETGTGTVETKWQRKDGKIVDIILSSTPIDLSDLSKGVVFTALDISDRKNLEQQIGEAEERFRLAMEASRDGIWDWDLLSGIVYYSPGWASMLGYEVSELETSLSTWMQLTHPDDSAKTFELFENYKSGKVDKFETEIRMKHKDGSWVDVLSRAKGVFDDEGNLLRLTGTHFDITQLLGIQRELQESERNLNNAQSFAGLGSWSWDLQSNETFWNDEMYKIFGRNTDDETAILDNWADYIHPIDRDWVVKKLETGINDGEGYELDFRIIREPDKEVRWISGKTGFNKENEKIIEAYGVIRDTTKRKESESVLNAFFEQPMNLHLISNLEGKIIKVNMGWEAILGFTTDELTGTKFFDYIHPDDIEKTEKELAALVDGNKTLYFENRYRCKDGAYRLVAWSALASLSDGRVYAVAQDITEQKKLEKELRVTEDRYVSALEAAADGIWYWNPQTDETYFSKGWKSMLGYEEHELEHNFQTLKDLIHESDKVTTFCRVRDLLEGRSKKYENTFRLRHKDGHYVWVLSKGTTIKNENGEVVNVTGTHVNITHQKETEEEIRRSRDYTEKLIKTSNAIIIGLGSKGDITVFNDEAESVTGYSKEELQGKNWFKVIVPKEVYPEVWEEFRRLQESGIARRFENPIRTKSGDERYIAWNNSEIVEDGNVVGTISFGLDITEQKIAEKRLKESKQRFENAFQNHPTAMSIARLKTGERLFVNNSFVALTGYSRESLLEQSMYKINCWKDPEQMSAMISELSSRGIVLNKNVVMIDAFGNDRDIIMNASMVEEGGEQLVITSVEDVTEKKQTEAKLIDSEQRYKALYDNAPLAYQSLNIDGLIIDVNPQWLKVLGYQRGKVLGQWFGNFLHGESVTHFKKNFPRFKKQGTISGVQFRMKHKDGRIIDVSFEGCIGYNEKNEVKQTYCTFKEITAQKIAQKESHESRQRLELALQIGNISICEWIPAKNFFYSDGKLEAFLDYDDDNVIHEIHSIKDKWNALLCEEDQEKTSIIDGLKEGESTSLCDCTFRMHKPNGEFKWIRSIVKATDFDTDGNPTRYLGIHVDVDQQKRQEMEALEHREKVMKADKLSTLGTLAAGVAHEINNPNQFILSNISLFEATWTGIREILDQWVENEGELEIAGFEYDELRQRYPKSIESMKTGSRRIKTIVKELKDYVRDNCSDSFNTVDVNKVIYSSQILTANLGKKKTNSFTWKTDGKLSVKGNTQKLEQVFVNLIVNAFESLTEKAESVSVKSYEGENDDVIVDVIDEGVGIPMDLMEKIREPFFTTKQSQGGTGMGLSVVESIIKEHGGRLEFIPNPDKGTCVRVILPKSE